MIELLNLTIANDPNRILLQNKSIHLEKGTLTALMGRNGSGKSTLLRVMAGLQKPVSGKVMIDGVDVCRAPAKQLSSLIAVITTENPRIENLTCRQLVAYGRAPHTGLLGRLSAEDEQIVDESLQLVGMQEFAQRKINHISDGERRRITLARALAQQTPVILLDEPTSFLDIPGRFEIAGLLARLCHDRQKTIVYSTHELAPAQEYADKILEI